MIIDINEHLADVDDVLDTLTQQVLSLEKRVAELENAKERTNESDDDSVGDANSQHPNGCGRTTPTPAGGPTDARSDAQRTGD